ncbi:MAG: glycosyltransferase [Desulfofustis sp.]|nr:glycosyltransferase [Desulfofustis sp.]
MKISMFTNTYLPHVGGVARSVSTFAAELRRQGHLVQVIAPEYAAADAPEEADSAVVRVPALQHFNGSDFSVRIPLPGIISEAISDFAPDIIHSHHPFLLGDAALRLARTMELPLVFTHHTLYEQYTHYVPLDSPALKRFVIELATGYANLCNRVIAPSSSVKNLLVKRGVRSNITVLPTGIDIDLFSRGDGQRFRKQYGLSDRTTVIGHVGRLAREKNLPYLAEAVATALKEHDRSCFLVIGTGDAEQEIRDVFTGRGCAEQLVMPGRLTGEQLADAYAAMDLFAFASRSETQGLVLAEAMAASTPVIALTASGVEDVVRHGVNGRLLAAEASTDEFARELLAMLTDSGQLAALRRAARGSAQEFSKETCTGRLADLYRETIGNDHRAHHTDRDIVDSIRLAIKAEWELFQEKTKAALSSLVESEDEA